MLWSQCLRNVIKDSGGCTTWSIVKENLWAHGLPLERLQIQLLAEAVLMHYKGMQRITNDTSNDYAAIEPDASRLATQGNSLASGTYVSTFTVNCSVQPALAGLQWFSINAALDYGVFWCMINYINYINEKWAEGARKIRQCMCYSKAWHRTQISTTRVLQVPTGWGKFHARVN